MQEISIDHSALQKNFVDHFKTFFTFDILRKSQKDSSENGDLIYHIDKIIDHQRLCISTALIKEILQLTHENNHSRFQRYDEIIIKS